VDALEAGLAAYYDLEGSARQAMPLGDGRLAARESFVERLRAEGRRSLVEVGSGPGRDAVAFIEAGLEVTAVDRSPGHVRLASGAGVRAVVASLLDLPFAHGTFDAGWTMSTLVHVPDDRWDRALASIVSAVGAGAPIAIGLWGGVDVEHWQDARTGLPARFFSRRSHDRVQAMLARHADVESFDTWPGEQPGWDYQLAVLRTPDI
jgi:SAM-dependent methyltransferase